jgi:hypothetical protein
MFEWLRIRILYGLYSIQVWGATTLREDLFVKQHGKIVRRSAAVVGKAASEWVSVWVSECCHHLTPLTLQALLYTRYLCMCVWVSTVARSFWHCTALHWLHCTTAQLYYCTTVLLYYCTTVTSTLHYYTLHYTTVLSSTQHETLLYHTAVLYRICTALHPLDRCTSSPTPTLTHSPHTPLWLMSAFTPNSDDSDFEEFAEEDPLSSWRSSRNYYLKRTIGRGSYGEVVEAEDVRSKQPVAIKRVQDIVESILDAKRIYREIHILRYM